MVHSVPDLVPVFDRKQLTEIIVQMVQSLPAGQLTEQKLSTLKELTHSPLFEHAECRAAMMQEISGRVGATLEDVFDNGAPASLLPLCIQTLGDVLNALHRFERARPGSTFDDVSVLIGNVLRTVVKGVAGRRGNGECGDEGVQALVANMIGLFRAMTPAHYDR